MHIKISEVKPGTILNLDPQELFVTEANFNLIDNEMTLVDSVNGGWADNLAGPDEVVVYSSSNLAEPIVMKAHQMVSVYVPDEVRDRLDYLRGEIEAERISQGEIAELQGLAEHIDPSDVQLLEWAGVPESEKM